MKKLSTKMMNLWVLSWLLIAGFLLPACNKDEPVDPVEQAPGVIEPTGDLFSQLFPEENDIVKYGNSGEYPSQPEDVNKGSYTVTYYGKIEEGLDSNDGPSVETPVMTLTKLQSLIDAGGSDFEILLFGSEEVYSGKISLSNKGDNARIRIGTYNTKPDGTTSTNPIKARIDAAGQSDGIYITKTSNVYISDIKITANGGTGVGTQRSGIRMENSSGSCDDITIYNVDIRDIFYYGEDVDQSTISYRPCSDWDTSGEDNYGWGIYMRPTYTGTMDNVKIIETNIRNVSLTAIKGSSGSTTSISNLLIDGCTGTEMGGPGVQFAYVDGVVMQNTSIVNAGSRTDRRMWGRGSGMWLMYCDNATFHKCLFEGAEGIADSCGAHIDHNNTNVIIQYCLSRNNAGGFIEVLGDNYNCTYRYNISINDGWRNPNDRMQYPHWGWEPTNGVGTNGVVMQVNGLNGDDPYEGAYATYIYNNTIVNTGSDSRGYTNPFIYEIATSVKGLVVMNNIFWIPERMENSWSSYDYDGVNFLDTAYDFQISYGMSASGYAQVRDMNAAEIEEMDLVIKNNIYQLYNSSYPTASNCLPTPATGSNNSYWDENPLGGDPYFGNPQGMEAENMIPRNSSVINRGATIPVLEVYTEGEYKPGDQANGEGIVGGLNMDEDFFGNTISTPIIGACVAQ